jgi:peptide deformylase
MAKILKIYSYQDPILRTKCRDILRMEPWVLQLADDMWMTMLMSKAVGLAANQVGFDYNVITIKGPEFQGPMINPVIEEASKEIFHYQEGCLSMVGYQMDTGKRSKTIKVSYHDLEGKKQTVTLSDMTAVIVQHEIDHLHGHLMTDYLDKSLYSSSK